MLALLAAACWPTGRVGAAEFRFTPPPDSEPRPATVSVASSETPRPSPFSRSKWDGPAAEVTQDARPDWKEAFRSRPRAIPDSQVVPVSAESAGDRVTPVLLPNPPPKRLRDNPDIFPPPKPIIVEQRPAGPAASEPVAPVSESPPVTGSSGSRPVARAEEKCISPHDLKSIGQITADIRIKREDLVKPDGQSEKPMPPLCSMGDSPARTRHWQRTTFAFTAASTCHKPVYFEDERLERYGHSWGPVRQTAASSVRFFATAPLLPYYMGVYPPNECIYNLGAYRPGSCAPHYLDPFPISVRGALFQGTFFGVLPAIF
jgi:hypothetical protein